MSLKEEAGYGRPEVARDPTLKERVVQLEADLETQRRSHNSLMNRVKVLEDLMERWVGYDVVPSDKVREG